MVMTTLVAGVVAQQGNSLIGSIIVASLTGVIITVGQIVGNKLLNKANREKYALEANNIMEDTCVNRSSVLHNQLKKIMSKLSAMAKDIKHNTKITKEYNSKVVLIDELKSIKKEALGWSKNRGHLSELVVIKANSMMSFFQELLNENVYELTLEDIKSEMRVRTIKVKKSWGMTLKDDEFTKYFYRMHHDDQILLFFTDLSWLLNPQRKINNINIEDELEIIAKRFFRNSLENLLATWESFTIVKDKG